MDAFFAAQGKPFRMFSLSHAIPTAVIILSAFLLYLLREKIKKSLPLQRTVRIAIPLITVLAFLGILAWNIVWGYFDLKYSLPFHLCDITFLLVIFLFLLPHQYLFEITYFIGIGGAMQALLTPALAYDFPHLGYFFFFAEHGVVILSALYFVFVRGRQATLGSVLRAMLFLNFIGAAVLALNLILGGNYMFLLRKPPSASLLDYLGEWPIYLLAAEAIAFCVFILLYLPFLLRKQRTGFISPNLSR